MVRMQTHPVFKDILLHTDTELAEIFGAGIKERKTIHQWPLSCVQQLCLESGKKLAYKSQLPPTVECDFYERASSALLPGHRVLGNIGRCHTMVLDWIDAPLLREAVHSHRELAAYGDQLLSQICEIRGDLPAYLDISSPEAWSRFAETTLERFRKLITAGKFTKPGLESVDLVKEWTESAKLLDMIASGESRLIHGDLKADQVFVLPDGFRVIDWQRPVIAPVKVDMVSLMVGEGIDPVSWVDSDIVKLFWFLYLAWAVEAQSNLFPEFKGPLFGKWAFAAVQQILR
jgi:hypothetical protein